MCITDLSNDPTSVENQSNIYVTQKLLILGATFKRLNLQVYFCLHEVVDVVISSLNFTFKCH